MLWNGKGFSKGRKAGKANVCPHQGQLGSAYPKSKMFVSLSLATPILGRYPKDEKQTFTLAAPAVMDWKQRAAAPLLVEKGAAATWAKVEGPDGAGALLKTRRRQLSLRAPVWQLVALSPSPAKVLHFHSEEAPSPPAPLTVLLAAFKSCLSCGGSFWVLTCAGQATGEKPWAGCQLSRIASANLCVLPPVFQTCQVWSEGAFAFSSVWRNHYAATDLPGRSPCGPQTFNCINVFFKDNRKVGTFVQKLSTVLWGRHITLKVKLNLQIEELVWGSWRSKYMSLYSVTTGYIRPSACLRFILSLNGVVNCWRLGPPWDFWSTIDKLKTALGFPRCLLRFKWEVLW